MASTEGRSAFAGEPTDLDAPTLGLRIELRPVDEASGYRVKEPKQEVLALQKKKLEGLGLSEEEVRRALEPMLSFRAQLEEEVEWYERVRRRDFGVIRDLSALGTLLIALRIANGLSQRELAEKLGVSEAQVSRDERNEYHGITVYRAQRVLDAMKETLTSRVEDKPLALA